ncbi:putative cytoplasmic protein [uncultured Gammaproteobacteria bacterium]|jgi:hypothetical protein|nr:putative cytoplasmic protein [uncultured Gammaproteobacteria bacterium]CAC9978094.1 hypothetical protein [uncultured Gammaproteobacteria bacterium]VVH56124.1 putative cytoplasmic protein [uncultured Gammaproteobacteria bacterium]
MDTSEKTFARIMFQNKIYKSDGQAFEDLFTAIMRYAEQDFQAIKAWGDIGDRKNDGYIESKGIFFQVYAPEEIQKSYLSTVRKIKTDFRKLKNNWPSVKEFYFVVNDKYKGVNADCEQALKAIKQKYQLKGTGFKTASNLEESLFLLEDDQIFSIIGCPPDPEKISLDYSVLNEVIGHLMKLPLPTVEYNSIVYPDWDNKIQFNGLTGLPSQYLKTAFYQVTSLDKYLNNESNFFAEEVKNKIREVYIDLKSDYSDDVLFWEIINKISPQQKPPFQTTVIILLAKYFETCDIFKEPE